jgi:hypothetical protein
MQPKTLSEFYLFFVLYMGIKSTFQTKPVRYVLVEMLNPMYSWSTGGQHLKKALANIYAQYARK